MNYGNRAPRAEYNVVCFIEDMNSVGDEINIDLTSLYNDASMIFENNPTHEGAAEAAELYLAVATDVSEQFTAEVRALISKHRLNRSQCRRLGIEGFLARVDQSSKQWLNKFRSEFVENAPDGATERLDRMSDVFSNMFEDIFCSNRPT